LKVGLVIFSRYDSRRLPGKVLIPIAKVPLLGHVIERARRVPGGHPLIVATSERPIDDPIAAYGQDRGVTVFRGDTENTLGRALNCARVHNLDAVARICGDSPFLQPDLFATLIGWLDEKRLDIATNTFPRSFPPGISTEVVTTEALARAAQATTDANEREHCTLYFYRHPDDFSIANLAAPDGRYDGIHLAVDTPEDLERSEWIARRLGSQRATAPLDKICDLEAAWSAEGTPAERRQSR
jgi:spore coat polysaccharide biosynthesis protein SpsF